MKLQYTLTKLLGHGSCGFVKEAETIDGLIIAVKIYKHNSADIGADIIREINTMKLLDHPHIIKLLQVTTGSGGIEIAMQHGGKTLSECMFMMLDFHREEMAPTIFHQILLAVSYIHSLGIIHRDIKPENILMEDGIARLCDFSIAKKIIPSRERAHTYKIGTSNYRAPELFGEKPKDYGIKIDIWALGCTFYEFLTKKILFKGSTDLSIITLILRVLQPSENDMRVAGLQEMRMPSYRITNTFDIINTHLRTMICHMLKFNARERMSAKNCLKFVPANAEADTTNANMVLQYNIRRYDEAFYIKSADHSWISKKTRVMCIELIESMCQSAKLEKQTFLTAVNIFDRYTDHRSVSQNLINNNMELIAHTSCFIASKYIDLRPIQIVHMGVAENDVISCEMRILKILNFNIDSPTLLDIYKLVRTTTPTERVRLVSDEHWKIIRSWVYDPCGKNAHEIKSLMQTFV
jgi:serine/threonine protein kinase